MFGKKLKTPPVIEDLATAYNDAAIESAFKLTKNMFDNSEQTIPILENILENLFVELHEVNLKKRIGLGPNEHDREQWANLWGFYLGETLRKMYGGKWLYGHEEAPHIPCLEFENGVAVFPTAKIFKRLENGKPDNIVEYCNLIKQEMQAT